MKNKFNRILSLVLVIASLVSSFAIFASADDDAPAGNVGKTGELEILYNRNYQEGWDYDNGFTTTQIQKHKVSIDYEETENGDYNYFMRFESAMVGTSGTISFDFGTSVAKEDKFGTVIEMRIKADDYFYDFGEIFSYSNGAGGAHNQILYIAGDKLMFNSLAPVEIGTVGDEWINVAISMDWTLSERNITVHYGELNTSTRTYQYQSTYTEPYTAAAQKGVKGCSFKIPAKTDANVGSGYCIDDLRIYNGSSVPVAFDAENEENAGIKVNSLLPKTITILENANVKSAEQILADALCLKVGVNFALVRDQRQPIFADGEYGAPVIVDGEVRVSLDLLLNYIGFPYLIHPDEASYDITTGTTATYVTVGRTTATVAGERVILNSAPGYVTADGGKKYLTIGMSDIEKLFPGWAVTYDDMGLILVYEEIISAETGERVDIVNRNDDLDVMLNIMKKFIFGVNTSTVKDDYINSGKDIYSDVKANTTVKDGEKESSFCHPYIIADQNTFNTLKAMYQSGQDATLKAYIAEIVSRADAIFNEYAQAPGGNYEGIKDGKSPVNIYSDGLDLSGVDDTDTEDGYNSVSGRVDTIATLTENLIPLAFAYQVTGNDKYAKLAYDYMAVLAAWEHWGHGYFIDCAEATSRYAIAYDWLYNAFVALEKDVTVLSDAIYNNGVHHGYVSSLGNGMEGTRLLGDESDYITRDDYWNAVGASGMIIGALAIMDRAEYLEEVYYLVGNNLAGLCLYGLDVYAPDGAYIESATNWCYGTNALFYLIMSLDSAAGNTYGFANSWGLEKTCYYALHIESSDGVIWNYHDGGFDGISGPLAGMETQIFNYVGKMFGDNTLIYVRQQQLKSGKKQVSVFDLLFYPFDGVEVTEELPLTYYMSGLEAYVVRSDWSDGALYAGLMGGPNDCNYGQLDSGNFIYHNKGVVWFMDLGSENTAVYDYYGTARNRYYRVNVEGQNLFYFTGTEDAYKYGQSETAAGIITSTFENQYGSYAILDNTSAYSSLAVSAKRGMLVTNNGNTVVIQDEVDFKLVRDCEWVAHTAEEISVSDDGKTAWLTSKGLDGKVVVLRASLVSPSDELVFSIRNTYKFSITSTYGQKDSVSNGGAPEYDRNAIKKLVIDSNKSIAFDASVVFEVVSSVGSDQPVGYTWQTMATWTPSVNGTGAEEGEELRGIPKKSDIRVTITKADTLMNGGKMYNETLDDFYKCLTLVGYTFKKFKIENDDSLTSLYTQYLDLMDEYEDYVDYVQETIDSVRLISERLVGLYVPEVEDEGDED